MPAQTALRLTFSQLHKVLSLAMAPTAPGGALIGVFDAFLGVVAFGGDAARKSSLHLLPEEAFAGVVGEAIAIVALVGLCTLIVRWSRRAA